MADAENALGDGFSDLENKLLDNIVWEGVTVSVQERRSKKEKIILDKISGVVQAGELSVVMGPSYVRCTNSLSYCADVNFTEGRESRPSSAYSRVAAFTPRQALGVECTLTVNSLIQRSFGGYPRTWSRKTR